MLSEEELQERLSKIRGQLLRIEQVVGVGIGKENDSPRIVVMLRTDNEAARTEVKYLMQDIPYKIEITGEFRPFPVADI